jgi:uncharacterized protein YfkK (UPF0435 family)
MEQSLRMALVLKDDVIKGFSYSFSAALLKKLKEMKEKDQIFEKGIKEALEFADKSESGLTDMAYMVTDHLHNQISSHSGMPNTGTSMYPKEVDRLIALAEEFLAIFQKKAK